MRTLTGLSAEYMTECKKMQSQNLKFYCDIGVGSLTVLTN